MRFNAATLIALGVAVAATLFIWFYLLDIVTPLVGAPWQDFSILRWQPSRLTGWASDSAGARSAPKQSIEDRCPPATPWKPAPASSPLSSFRRWSFY
ncbi:hypothetical protein C8J31_103134 [Rhizobium sp. PP-CC-2G-626]|nr:hypothetical protein C8J31_103134 [Rhizobium sp. PP-CC-2G-626]